MAGLVARWPANEREAEYLLGVYQKRVCARATLRNTVRNTYGAGDEAWGIVV